MLSYEQMWDMPMSRETVSGHSSDAASGARHIPHLVGNVIYAVVAAVFKIAFRYRVVGRENLRRFAGERGCLVVGNHVSYLDPAFLWLAARPKQWIRFMARENMFSNVKGLAGQIISRVGAFPIKRASADRTAIKRATSMLKRGEVVGIFPEGTRRGRGSAAPELHSGAAFIARMGGKAPIVPSTVRNVEKVKQKGSRMHFPAITVVFGAPVFGEDFDFLPKEDRLDAISWYVMRECYALRDDVGRQDVDMRALFPDAKDFTEAFRGRDMGRA